MVECKPALTGTKEWADSNINFLTGCANNCWYCYARQFAFRFGRIGDLEDWKNMVLNQKAVQRKYCHRSGRIMFPSTHDLFPEHLPTILKLLRRMLEAGNRVLVVTKPRMEVVTEICHAVRNWYFGACDRVEFRFTITSFERDLSLKYEPGAPLPSERMKCLRQAADMGFETSVSIEPFLEQPVDLYHAILQETQGEIWIGAMNHGAPAQLRHLYTRENMHHIWDELAGCNQVKFKDSFRKAGICDSDGRAL